MSPIQLELRTLALSVLVSCFAVACSSHEASDPNPSTGEGGPAGARAGSGGTGRGGASDAGRAATGRPGRAGQAGQGGEAANSAETGESTNEGEAGEGGEVEGGDQPTAGTSAGGRGASAEGDAGEGDDTDDAGPAEPAGPLRIAAQNAERLISAAIEADPLAMDEAFARTAAAEFTTLMPVSATKWVTLEGGVRGEWWFDPADAIVAAARKAGQNVRGHALFDGGAPAWATALSSEEYRSELERHVKTTIAHFKGKIVAWDVIADAIDETTLQLRVGPYATLGVAGLADIFKWAKQADPAAQLYYDDYGIESPGGKTEAVLKLLADLKAAGAEIDGVGMRSHLDTVGYPSASGLRTNLQRFAAIVPAVMITELDVGTKLANAPDATRRFAAQRLVYQQVAGVCAGEAACRGITTYGISDKYGLIEGDEPLPYDADSKAKPAAAGLIAGFGGKAPKLSETELLTNGDFSNSDTGWWLAFGGGTLTVQTTVARSGSAAAVSDRMNAYEGVAQSLLDKIKSEDGLCFSVRVRVDAASAQVAAYLKIDTGTPQPHYRQLGSVFASNMDWVELSGCGAVYIPDNAIEASLHVSGPPPGVTIYVDDASLRKLSAD